MNIFSSIRTAIYDTTTGIVSGFLALTDPVKANEYRYNRSIYKRAYIASNLTGPYQLHRPSVSSGTREVVRARRGVNARVKDQERNNGFVSGIIQKNTTSIVGDEIGIKFGIEDDSGKPLDLLNKILEERFYDWEEQACSDGLSLSEAAHLTENHMMMDGEIIHKDDFDTEASGNPYRIQPLESEHIDGSKTMDGTGIERDAKGRALNFWLYKNFPDGFEGLSESVRVKASEITHIFRQVRASQRRGISPLAPSLQKIYMIDDLEDAELVASRAAASFGLIIETPVQEATPLPVKKGETTGETVKDENGRDRGFMPSGGVFEALPGEKVSSFKNERPNPNFEPFRRGCQRVSAHSIGMSYEKASGDYSQVNYSSAKMGDGVDWANVKRQQTRLRKKFFNPIIRKWLKYEIITVGVPGISVSAYLKNPKKYEKWTLQLAGREGADPKKDVETFKEELILGVNSRTRYAAEKGRDIRELAKEIAQEEKMLRDLQVYRDPAGEPKQQQMAEAQDNAKQ